MSVWLVRHVMPSWGWEDTPPVLIENEVGNSARLQRRGIKSENFNYAPVVREGDFYQTSEGDRIRIEQKVIQQDGSLDIVVREAVDTGRSVPQFVQPIVAEEYGITDEERAAGDAQREAYNEQIRQQNLAANYTEPYAPVSESAPDYSYNPQDGGYVESESTYVPQGTVDVPYQPPDVPVVVQPPPPPVTQEPQVGGGTGTGSGTYGNDYPQVGSGRGSGPVGEGRVYTNGDETDILL